MTRKRKVRSKQSLGYKKESMELKQLLGNIICKKVKLVKLERPLKPYISNKNASFIYVLPIAMFIL